jgi:urate oxidase
VQITAELKSCTYGKSGVRLLKVERQGCCHHVKDIKVAVQVCGAFTSAYREGNNHEILPTDTMKNTVYALARQASIGEIERFGLRLSEHFLARNAHFSNVCVSLTENIWRRIACDGRPHNSAFQLCGAESRTAVVESDREHTSVKAAIQDLRVLKTSQSAFAGFLRDEYTTLAETKDRLLGTRINAEWRYNSDVRDFDRMADGVRQTLMETFAAHDSQSVQHTLYALGEAVLQRFSDIQEVRLSMPNLHYLPVDLSAFQMDNPNELFLPVEEPSGLIEATLSRPHALES